MKILACVLLWAAAPALADEASDLAAIAKLIAGLNGGKPRPELQCGLVPAGAMSEVTSPHVSTRGIQFITPEVALVDAENTQFGSTVMVRRVPIVFLVKREGAEWKIAATRAHCPTIPLPGAR